MPAFQDQLVFVGEGIGYEFANARPVGDGLPDVELDDRWRRVRSVKGVVAELCGLSRNAKRQLVGVSPPGMYGAMTEAT